MTRSLVWQQVFLQGDNLNRNEYAFFFIGSFSWRSCCRDLVRAHRVASRLQTGNVYINNYNIYPPELPFGGNKKSGIGRECGTECFEYFTQVKTVFVESGDVWSPYS